MWKRLYSNPAACSSKMGKNLASIIDIQYSVIRYEEIIEEERETVTTNFNEKNVICKTKHFYVLLAVLLITIALQIAVSIYCSPIKCKAKQKHFLPFYITNEKLREV